MVDSPHVIGVLKTRNQPPATTPAIKERKPHHSHYSRNSHEPRPIPVSAHTNLGHLTTPTRRPPELAPRPLEIEAPKQGLLPTVLRCVSLLRLIHPRPPRIPEISANSSVFRSIVGASATKTEAKNRNKEEERRGEERRTRREKEGHREGEREKEKKQKNKNKREQELRARERGRPKLFSAAPALPSGRPLQYYDNAAPRSSLPKTPLPGLQSPLAPPPRLGTGPAFQRVGFGRAGWLPCCSRPPCRAMTFPDSVGTLLLIPNP